MLVFVSILKKEDLPMIQLFHWNMANGCRRRLFLLWQHWKGVTSLVWHNRIKESVSKFKFLHVIYKLVDNSLWTFNIYHLLILLILVFTCFTLSCEVKIKVHCKMQAAERECNRIQNILIFKRFQNIIILGYW